MLTQSSAIPCFNASTEYIEMFNKISNKLFVDYNNDADNIYNNALQSLYITILLWFSSFIALIFLTTILRKALDKEEQSVEQLTIAAYAFDAHEAMVVTDSDGVIIQVNSAFSEITGYSMKEVLNKHTRILKSNVHGAQFYKEMWDRLIKLGQWHGEIYNKRKNGEIYPERLSITAIKNKNLETTHYIAQFLDISDIKNAQELLQHQADHDFLTSLLNRRSLMQRLNEEYLKATRHNFRHAFLFIDIDGFKLINDTYGHIVGDKVIKEVSKKISSILREEDICARISGDEFGVVIVNLDSDIDEANKSLRAISTKILNETSKEFTIDSNLISISVSIGIKIFPANEISIQDIIIHADTAMYQAKNQGKNQYVFFEKDTELK